MISIIVPTNRIGGLDLLFDSLVRQSYQNFELILVDNIKPWRRGIQGPGLGNRYPFDGNLQHIEPRDNPFPQVQYCRTMNTGVAHAHGEILLYLCDYSYLAEDCLAQHAALQKLYSCPITLDYKYVGLPPLKRPLDYREPTPGTEALSAEYTAEVNANTARYLEDLKSGKLNDLMWSIFEKPLTPEAIAALPVEHEHKPSGADLAVDWNWCSFKNESFPTKLILDMNGHDERYDESHGWQDSEFSYRLRERGIRWQTGQPGAGMVTIVNPRNVMNIKHLSKKIFHNKYLCDDELRADKHVPVNPGFSLREWRQKVTGIS
jgi:glycosyltransferase involved in cell wall biosynthesis